MKVAIVGSRGWEDYDAIWEYVLALPEGTVVISGGAPGVDEAALRYAQVWGFVTANVRPAWKDRNGHYNGRAGFSRNKVIVQLADRVVAFWDGRSRGTADTIRWAKKLGKPLEVIRATGSEARPQAQGRAAARRGASGPRRRRRGSGR